jgi:threonine/homoserine/homoserine lactone efflux protein
MFDESFYRLAVALFLLWVALLLTPGPDFIMMLRATVNHGRRHAVATGTGITTALGIYIALVILGFEFLYQNDGVYQTLKYAGAIYLVYIGIGTLRSKTHIATINKTGDRQQSIFDSFRQGFFCNILNPKAPILIGSIFSQLIGASTSTSLKLVFGIEMLLINLLVWGFFPNLIQIGIINRLLKNTQRVNVVLGIALCVLGGVAFL